MTDDIYRARDLPRINPGALDSVVGVDESTGALRRFPVPVSGTPTAYETVADLPATADEGAPAYVNNDPTADNNGLWAYFGGTWVQADDRLTDVEGRLVHAESVADAVDLDGHISDDLLAFKDGAGKVFGRVGVGADWDILLAAIATADGLEIYEYESLGDDSELVVVDAEGKILARMGAAEGTTDAEVVAARGDRDTLDERLSASLSDYGMPKRHAWGEWYLRETRQRLRVLALGESTQHVIASIGDSWTHNAARYSDPTADTLKAEYGDAGAGYVSFGKFGASLPNGNVHSNAAVTYTGTWDTSVYYTAYSPDLGQATSSTAGDKLSYTVGAAPSAVELYAKGGAGVVRYRFNAGAWTSIDLSALAAGLHVLPLASPAAGVFDVEVVSGAPVLFGIDVRSATDGIRWHKLGSTGSRGSHWASVDATNWQAGLAALEPSLVTVLHGTNDQAAYSPDTYRTHMQTLIDRVRASVPLADVLLIAPCENGRANTYAMSLYAAVLYELAVENRCAYLDLQYVFGDSFSEYASTSDRPWFNADDVHPEPATGGRAIVDAVYRLLTE